MVARLPKLLRRGPRPRTADDDDWGTSSPDPPIPVEMDPSPASASASASAPRDEIDAVESDHAVLPKPPSKIEKLQAQELKSYTLLFSPRLVISVYFVIGVVFVPIGSAIVAGTAQIRTAGPFRYDDICGKDKSCRIEFNVSKTIPSPSYFYYSLGNYYQNARKYAKSRSDSMNEGKLPSVMFDVENCDPWLYKPSVAPEDREFDPNKFIYPCGLTARSFFNDSFQICDNNDGNQDCRQPVRVRRKGISWWTDREHKFRAGEDEQFKIPETNISFNTNKSANELLTDEDFIVWMRLAAFPDFSKLFAVIEQPLLSDRNYTLVINNHYPVKEFAGTKSFHITTLQWFGDSNIFLGTAFLVVGFIALFIATTMLVKHIRNPRPPAYADSAIIVRELAKFNTELRKASPGQ